MDQALRQAMRGWGRTSPNPMVGAVVVRDGVLVGCGYHRRAGTPHAEVHALADAGANSRGATVYVTLEPCCTQGRTPPCTRALVDAGVRRVVIGCLDPNPRHAGRAVGVLQSEGIEVEHGVLEEECRRLNDGFFWWITHARPYVVLKMAMTLDGRIATAGGDSKWVTGPRARARVQRMRRWADAIMVGGETTRMDNPSLTVRTPQNWWRQPERCVWTSRPLSKSLSVCVDADMPPTVAKPQNTPEWLDFLGKLSKRDVTALLLEGGGELAASALAAGVVNQVVFFVAPKILGGRESRPVVGGASPERLSDALALENMHTEQVGADILVMGDCTNVYGID